MNKQRILKHKHAVWLIEDKNAGYTFYRGTKPIYRRYRKPRTDWFEHLLFVGIVCMFWFAYIVIAA